MSEPDDREALGVLSTCATGAPPTPASAAGERPGPDGGRIDRPSPTGRARLEGGAGPHQAERFASIEELRTTHAAIARRLRGDGGRAELWDEVRDFLVRTRATGAVLEGCDDRAVAQAILNHWSSALYR